MYEVHGSRVHYYFVNITSSTRLRGSATVALALVYLVLPGAMYE